MAGNLQFTVGRTFGNLSIEKRKILTPKPRCGTGVPAREDTRKMRVPQ
jgi:hypothetical protein